MYPCWLEGSFYVAEPQNMTGPTQYLTDLSNLRNRNSRCTNRTKAQFCRSVHFWFQQETQHLILIKASQYFFFLFHCQPLIITRLNIQIFTQTIPNLTDYNTKSHNKRWGRFQLGNKSKWFKILKLTFTFADCNPLQSAATAFKLYLPGFPLLFFHLSLVNDSFHSPFSFVLNNSKRILLHQLTKTKHDRTPCRGTRKHFP